MTLIDEHIAQTESDDWSTGDDGLVAHSACVVQGEVLAWAP
jgi:hypothetical protein